MMDDEQSEAADAKYVSSLNPEFGDARGFWNRYEELAGSNDRELSNDLNANLDTLLIFVCTRSHSSGRQLSLNKPFFIHSPHAVSGRLIFGNQHSIHFLYDALPLARQL